MTCEAHSSFVVLCESTQQPNNYPGLWKEQKHLSELIICAAQQAVNQYLAPTLGQDGRDTVIQRRVYDRLMKAWTGLGCTLNQCKEEVLCLAAGASHSQSTTHFSK